MLNTTEKFNILKFIKNCCSFSCFPAVVDLPNWQLLPRSTIGSKRWLRLAYFASFVLHLLYKAATLLAALSKPTATPLHQLVIHGILAFSGASAIYWYYQIFISNPGAYGIFLHITLTGNIGGMRTTQVWRPKGNIVSRLQEYTLQDLIAISIPFMVAPIILTTIGLYSYYPTLESLLYAGLPKQLQGWFPFGVLLLEEMRYELIICSLALPMFILQIIAFDLVNNQLKSLVGTIKRTTSKQELLDTYASLRHIQLYVIIINLVNRYLIFSWKVLCIGMSIGTGYAAIAHFSDFPIFGVMYYLILIDATFIYAVCYDKAFQIAGLFETAAQLGLLRLVQRGYGDMRILKRQMRSIPRVGIKVGEFHVLERQSTPTFVQFVLSNIVNMLVAYR